MVATIKCPACGADVQDTMRFCSSCGAQLPKEEPVEENLSTAEPASASAAASATALPSQAVMSYIQKYWKWLVGAVALVFLLILAVNLLKPAKYTQPKKLLTIIPKDDAILVEVNHKQTAKIACDNIACDMYRWMVSLDGSKAVIAVRDEVEDDYFTLYMQDGKKIADHVTNFLLSASGNGVVYERITDSGEDDTTYEIGLWNGKNVTIHRDYHSEADSLAISPDGKTVAYSLDEDDASVGYYYDGKERTVGKDTMPVALSNGGKYIYYLKSDTLYVQKKDRSDSRVKLGEDVKTAYFNRDLSQIIYTAQTDNGIRTYFSKNGGEKISLKGQLSELLLPRATSMTRPQIVGIDGFENSFYRSDDNDLYYINKKMEVSTVVSNVNTVFLAEDGKTVTYLKNSAIYQLNGSKENAEKVKLVEDDVAKLIATTDDGKAVFFINDDKEIRYQKGTGKTQLVTDDFSDYSSELFRGKTFFYVCDDKLYRSDGGKGSVIKGLTGEIETVYADSFEVSIYVTNDDGDRVSYYSTNGKSFRESK